MTIEYEVDVSGGRDWTVDGDGEVCMVVDDYSGWDGAGEQVICFEIADLEKVVKMAKRHKAAYQAHKAADYDDNVYTTMMEKGDE